MKIEEVYSNDYIKLNRKSVKKMKFPLRSVAKGMITLLVAGIMCIGSYHYGFESNQSAVKNLAKKVDTLHSSLYEMHDRSRRDVDDLEQIINQSFSMQHHVEVHGNEQTFEITTTNEGVHNHDHPQESSYSLPKGGATYTRWGRRDCPQNVTGTSLLYEGIAAGSHFGHTGGGSNVLCLDLNVSYSAGHFKNGNQGASFLFGLEYRDAAWADDLLDLTDIEGENFRQYDVPCAVCVTRGRTSQLMIPGRDTCPSGWNKEYVGYIYGSANTHKHTTDFICIDRKPQIVLGSDGDQGGSLMYMVETQCPSLQCGPYVHGRELICVVCTI